MTDEYKTLKVPSTGIFKDKGSKFAAYAFGTETEAEFKEKLEEIKKEHFKARHHCYAYIFGTDGTNFRYNDDGEPSGTAGIPIYNQLRSFELANTGIVVVRYFGGIKLGVPGLINAYKNAAKDALDNGEIIVKYNEKTIEIRYSFEHTGDVMKVVNAGTYRIVGNYYDPSPKLILKVRESKAEELKSQILAALLKRDIAEITGDEIVEGVKIFIYD
jgi:uncharacterized YigZ family protein